MASLTEELEPCDELRQLVKNLGAGQLVREMEPSEGALREAKLALKMGRFCSFSFTESGGDSQDEASTCRIQFALDFPSLWAAVLQQRCSMGDVLNWIAQVCLVATDSRRFADPNTAEKVASVCGFRLLHEAYQSVKAGVKPNRVVWSSGCSERLVF